MTSNIQFGGCITLPIFVPLNYQNGIHQSTEVWSTYQRGFTLMHDADPLSLALGAGLAKYATATGHCLSDRVCSYYCIILSLPPHRKIPDVAQHDQLLNDLASLISPE